MQHALGPGAVVREQQQALRIRVEPADRIEPLARADVIDDRATPALVVRGRNDTDRFVQQDVPMRRRRRNRSAIDLDARVFHHPRAKRRDELAIDAHASPADELLGVATRCDAAVRHHLLQPDHALVSPTGSPRLGMTPSGVRARGSSSRLDRPKHSRNSQVVP